MKLLLLCLLSLCALAENPMYSKAKAARKKAESSLAEMRSQTLKERQILNAQIKKAYEDLAAIRKNTDASETALAQLTTQLKKAKSERSRIAQNNKRLINEVITASGMAHDQNLDWKQQQEAIRTGIKQRLTELDSSLSIRSTQSDVLNRAGNKVSVKVIHLGEIGKIAAGSSPQDCGFLQQTLDGHLFISGVEFDAKHVADLSADTLSLLPVDLDGSLVKKALSEKRTVMGWLKAGGGFVIPILAIALLALFLGVERLYSLYTLRSSPALINTVLADLQSHKNDEALEKVANENSPLSRILKCGLESINDGREVRMAKLETAILDEEPRLERSMGLLAALAAIAPLLGLLGTVTGMISTFDVIAQYGTSNPKLLSGGISVALITTQLGLMVAVPILLFHAWLSRIIERRMVILEQAINALLGIEKADS